MLNDQGTMKSMSIKTKKCGYIEDTDIEIRQSENSKLRKKGGMIFSFAQQNYINVVVCVCVCL